MNLSANFSSKLKYVSLVSTSISSLAWICSLVRYIGDIYISVQAYLSLKKSIQFLFGIVYSLIYSYTFTPFFLREK